MAVAVDVGGGGGGGAESEGPVTGLLVKKLEAGKSCWRTWRSSARLRQGVKTNWTILKERNSECKRRGCG